MKVFDNIRDAFHWQRHLDEAAREVARLNDEISRQYDEMQKVVEERDALKHQLEAANETASKFEKTKAALNKALDQALKESSTTRDAYRTMKAERECIRVQLNSLIDLLDNFND